MQSLCGTYPACVHGGKSLGRISKSGMHQDMGSRKRGKDSRREQRLNPVLPQGLCSKRTSHRWTLLKDWPLNIVKGWKSVRKVKAWDQARSPQCVRHRLHVGPACKTSSSEKRAPHSSLDVLNKSQEGFLEVYAFYSLPLTCIDVLNKSQPVSVTVHRCFQSLRIL